AAPVDLAAATMIKTERPIENPRQVRTLRLRLSGLADEHLALSDARQRATVERKGKELQATVELQAGPAPEHGDPVLTGREDPFVQDAEYLGIDDAEIRAQASEIA